MPKKPADKLRIPLNCLIAPATKESITGLQNESKESQGEIVDRAVALLAFGEEIERSKTARPTKEQFIASLQGQPEGEREPPRTFPESESPRRTFQPRTGFVRGIRPKGDTKR